MPEPVRLGAVSLHQDGHQAAHAAGSAGRHPAFIHISGGNLHDVNVLDLLAFEAGAFDVMDRGYVDFARLHALHQAGAFFVTRAKSPLDARRV